MRTMIFFGRTRLRRSGAGRRRAGDGRPRPGRGRACVSSCG